MLKPRAAELWRANLNDLKAPLTWSGVGHVIKEQPVERHQRLLLCQYGPRALE
jgi:hypothetical protein